MGFYIGFRALPGQGLAPRPNLSRDSKVSCPLVRRTGDPLREQAPYSLGCVNDA